MGITIVASFETLEGIPISSPYCRITQVMYDSAGNGVFTITMKVETHYSRDARLGGKFPIRAPGLPSLVSVSGTIGDMTYLYGRLKTHLEAQGLTVEDVLEPTPEASLQSSESTQTTLPTPPPPEEPQE
jgi:hypothetical protein